VKAFRMSRLPMSLVLAALLSAPALAQNPNYTPDPTSAPLPPTVSFTNAPTWEMVPGTQVSVIKPDQRPQYDLFNMGNEFFLYSKGTWYKAGLLNGPYVALEADMVPPDLKNVPRAAWINFPDAWETKTAKGSVVTPTPVSNWVPTVEFAKTPHWTLIPGTRVYRVRADQRPDYDLFRYGAIHYVYREGNWYSATTANGPYLAIANDVVPVAFRKIQKSYWVSYPADWSARTKSKTIGG
jgi:hypothetical protein